MKRRNILAVIVLSIITLGIYDLFWLARTKQVLNRDTDQQVPSMWFLLSPLLFMVAGSLIIAAIVFHNAKVISNATLEPLSQVGLGNAFDDPLRIALFVIYALTAVAILPVTFYWFLKYAKAADAYTDSKLNTVTAFIMLWLLRFVGIAVAQHVYNKSLDEIVDTKQTLRPL